MTFRWGIMGAGNIAHRFANCISKMPDSQLLGIACRTREKTEKFAEWFHTIDQSVELHQYDSYEDLLLDSEIDAIYLSLPHGLHCHWTLQALTKHKAVLCEKPAMLDSAEMRMVSDAAKENKTLFMEAMKARFVPAYQEMASLIRKGVIGDIIRMETTLCVELPEMGDTYHYQPGQGGVLLDMGIYLASWLEDWLTGDIIVKETEVAFKNGIDCYVKAQLLIGGKEAILECAFDRNKMPAAIITGTKGKIEVPMLHRMEKFLLVDDNGVNEKVVPYHIDDFYGEIAHFEDCCRRGKLESPIMSLEASIRCAEILDSIRFEFTNA